MSCPICAKDSDARYRPFCSRHCADIDLGRWLSGSYAVPSQAEDDNFDPRDGDGKKGGPQH